MSTFRHWQHTPKGQVHAYKSDAMRALCGKTHESYYDRTAPGWPRKVDKPVSCSSCLSIINKENDDE